MHIKMVWNKLIFPWNKLIFPYSSFAPTECACVDIDSQWYLTRPCVSCLNNVPNELSLLQ